MFLGKIKDYLVPTGMANTVIPIKTETNTNDKIVNNKGTISFLKNGTYNIDCSISVSATTAQNVNVSIYTDDGERTTIPATIPEPQSGSESGIANVSLVDAIKVILTKYISVANIYIAVDQSDVTVNGIIRIEYIK